VYISSAVRNKGNNKWTFYISRRLNDAHGKFLGLVLVGLSVDAFTDFYTRVGNSIGAATSVSLYRNDLTLLARSPHSDNMIGKINNTGSVFQAYLAMKAQGTNDSTILASIPMFSTGTPMLRLTALRATDNYPLLVSLTIQEDIILASWRHNAALIAGVAISSSLILLFGIASLTRNLKQREQSEENLLKSISERKQLEQQQRIAATAFESHDGMFITDANNFILRVNEAFCVITGYTPEEVIGQNPRMFGSERHGDAFYADMWYNINNSGAWKGEIWNRRKNGEIYPEYLSITAVKDQSGNVSNYVGSFTDATAIKAAEEEIRTLAFYDSLTGLPNRRLLQDRLKQACASSGRSGKEGALMFIDLDNFKELNDNLGHDIGDMLLQQAAQRLTACVREGDTVARLGGDEFVVILEDLSEKALDAAEQIEVVGEKILATLNQPYQLAKHAHHSSASIGATLFTDQRQSIDNLLKQADIAMYQSKKAGRNTLRFFDPKMQESISARAELEVELRKALENQQFQLYYQVQVDNTHRSTGAEALIRWIHPDRGVISPNQFIPLAEETGMILQIGHWVLETACVQLVNWSNQPELEHLTIAVNVSALQFQQDDFADMVMKILEQTGANPHRLKLELTESMLIHNVEGIISKMRTLKAMGVGFALDDFGTGYSSLSYLKQLPLDQLKIDRSFVFDLEMNPDAVAICAATISMAHSLNLQVIAEGVETQTQNYILNLIHHCDSLQGYLFGKPLPIEQFEASLKMSQIIVTR
jgi:diguanylate cyclase (GGDEF)-like protein/PAS domain S-box-containing protein